LAVVLIILYHHQTSFLDFVAAHRDLRCVQSGFALLHRGWEFTVGHRSVCHYSFRSYCS